MRLAAVDDRSRRRASNFIWTRSGAQIVDLNLPVPPLDWQIDCMSCQLWKIAGKRYGRALRQSVSPSIAGSIRLYEVYPTITISRLILPCARDSSLCLNSKVVDHLQEQLAS